MRLSLAPGNYVTAVSGGVDSVALLDILIKQPGLELTVAHFDHGIRADSVNDRYFVEALARKYGLSFAYEEGHLGPGASEAAARDARYKFLRKVMKKCGAKAIITAQHQDDALETAILNMLRGTGRKGLTALKNQLDVVRPLLKFSKQEVVDYARSNKLEWREDPTNQDQAYLRNYVRHSILPRFSAGDRAQLLDLLAKADNTNQAIDAALADLLKDQPAIKRTWFNQLPHSVAKETIATWLRGNNLRNFDSKTLERLVTAAKTAATGKQFPVIKGAYMLVNEDHLALKESER